MRALDIKTAYAAVGNSLTAGFQNYGLGKDWQDASYPALIALAMEVEDFEVPLIANIPAITTIPFVTTLPKVVIGADLKPGIHPNSKGYVQVANLFIVAITKGLHKKYRQFPADRNCVQLARR